MQQTSFFFYFLQTSSIHICSIRRRLPRIDCIDIHEDWVHKSDPNIKYLKYIHYYKWRKVKKKTSSAYLFKLFKFLYFINLFK